MMNKRAWKVLEKGLKSNYDNSQWKVGEWRHIEGELELYKNGLHASHLLIDAMRYVIPGVIARVEYKGDIIEDENKFAASSMRIIKTYKLTKRKAVELAIYSAKICLPNYENYYSDDRPRQAIEAAEKYLKSPTKKNKDAVESAARSAAGAAWAAARSAAESAARSAAESAAMSVWAAWAAAESAAESAAMSVWAAWAAARSAAESAARSAAGAAWAAAESAAKQKIENKLLKIIGVKK